MKKITNEIMDQWLIDNNRPIKRIDDINGTERDCKWLCLNCNKIFYTAPKTLRKKECGKHGCQNCAIRARGKNKQHPENQIHILLIDRQIRMENYNGMCNYANFYCLHIECGYNWIAKPNDVINKESGCMRCAGKEPWSNEEVDEFLKINLPNVERKSDCYGIFHNINLYCKDCDYYWSTLLTNIVNGKHGCHSCAKQIKLTNEIIDQRLLNRPIKRLGNVINKDINILFKCLIDDCRKEWLASPHNVSYNNTGCPHCSLRKNEKIVMSFLQEHNIMFTHNYSLKLITNERVKKIDFYLPIINLMIEYNGAQHYQPTCFGSQSLDRAKEAFIKQQRRDQALRDYCQQNNIKLLEIDGRQYRNQKLKNFLNTYFKDLIVIQNNSITKKVG
jgi:hypothetical protein